MITQIDPVVILASCKMLLILKIGELPVGSKSQFRLGLYVCGEKMELITSSSNLFSNQDDPALGFLNFEQWYEVNVEGPDGFQGRNSVSLLFQFICA